jgi:hypothetical protein
MILALIIGYLIGRLVHHRYGSPLIALVAGLVSGVLSGFWFVPLMYPLFVVEGTGIIIPENLELVVCFVAPDLPLYSDVVLRLYPLSISIMSTMVGTGILGTLLGWWAGRVPEPPAETWEEED